MPLSIVVNLVIYSRYPPFSEKKLINLVLLGLKLVRASFQEFTNLFIRKDFPILDLPAKAISGLPEGGN